MNLRRGFGGVLLLALSLGLAGCETSDVMDKIVDLSPFGDFKKPIPGERKRVFPEGVPGVPQGVPPELMKGAQQPEGALSTEPQPQPPAETAAKEPEKPKAKPKSKPKPKVKQVARPKQQEDAPASSAPWPAPPQQDAPPPWPSQQSQQLPSAWPSPPPAQTTPRFQ